MKHFKRIRTHHSKRIRLFSIKIYGNSDKNGKKGKYTEMVTKMERKENKDMEEEKCWICKRGFVDALEEFNKKMLSNIYIDDNIKSRYEKGKKEFFPFTTDKFVEFLLADVKGSTYSLSGKVVGDVFIWLWQRR